MLGWAFKDAADFESSVTVSNDRISFVRLC